MHFNGYDIVLLCPEGFDYEDRANQALKICDVFLGDGLYSKERIDEICRKEHHYFYLIMKEDEVAGIYYHFADAFETIDFLADVSVEGISATSRVGVSQSIALQKEIQRKGIGEKIHRACMNFLFEEENVEAVFIPAWKQGDRIPAKKLLENCACELICVLKQPWAMYEGLSCPVCNHKPCTCDGAIYMKKEQCYE